MNLSEQKCVPCKVGMSPMSEGEVAEHLKLVPTWALKSGKLAKHFEFKDFKEAMIFVNKVADIAEAEGHHPDISISYNKVDITLFTHAVKGLSQNDFILAAKIDTLNA